MFLPGNVTWAVQSDNLPKLHELVSRDPSLAKLRANEDSYTLLHKCAQYSSPDILPVIEMLIAAGADVNARDYTYRGVTPLHMACSEYGDLAGHIAVAERLLAAGADPNAQTITDDDIERYKKTRVLSCTGLAPLHFMMRQKQSDLIPVLLRYGASPTLFSHESNYGSPIDSARRANWRRHLPEFLKTPIDFPRTLTVKIRTVAEEPPSALLFEYSFDDPQTTPVCETSEARRARVEVHRLEEVPGPGQGEELTLTPKIEVPLAADGLPCTMWLEAKATGPDKRVQYGFYTGTPIRYSDMWPQHLSPVNFRKGVDYEYPNVMWRKGGDDHMSSYSFALKIAGE